MSVSDDSLLQNQRLRRQNFASSDPYSNNLSTIGLSVACKYSVRFFKKIYSRNFDKNVIIATEVSMNKIVTR